MTLKEKLTDYMLANDYDDKDVARILDIPADRVWALRVGVIKDPLDELKYKLVMMLGEDI